MTKSVKGALGLERSILRSAGLILSYAISSDIVSSPPVWPSLVPLIARRQEMSQFLRGPPIFLSYYNTIWLKRQGKSFSLNLIQLNFHTAEHNLEQCAIHVHAHTPIDGLHPFWTRWMETSIVPIESGEGKQIRHQLSKPGQACFEAHVLVHWMSIASPSCSAAEVAFFWSHWAVGMQDNRTRNIAHSNHIAHNTLCRCTIQSGPLVRSAVLSKKNWPYKRDLALWP